MADDLTNLTSVEDDAPAPVAAAPEPEPVAPEVPADPDEAEAVDLPAGKHVPLAALKTVRDENKQLRERAQYAEQLAQQNAHLQGQLQSYQQVSQQLQQQRQSAPPAAPQADETALTFARGLDLYRQDANGQAVPDVEKAQAILGIVKQLAKQEAGNLVGPIAQATARERAIANYQWALGQKDPSGKAVSKQLVDEIWKTMPIEHTADPQVAKTLLFTAMGMERMHNQPAPAAPNPPVMTEGVGGVPRQRFVMSDLEQKIAKDRGVDSAKWQELSKGFKPGHTNIMED